MVTVFCTLQWKILQCDVHLCLCNRNRLGLLKGRRYSVAHHPRGNLGRLLFKL